MRRIKEVQPPCLVQELWGGKFLLGHRKVPKSKTNLKVGGNATCAPNGTLGRMVCWPRKWVNESKQIIGGVISEENRDFQGIMNIHVQIPSYKKIEFEQEKTHTVTLTWIDPRSRKQTDIFWCPLLSLSGLGKTRVDTGTILLLLVWIINGDSLLYGNCGSFVACCRPSILVYRNVIFF